MKKIYLFLVGIILVFGISSFAKGSSYKYKTLNESTQNIPNTLEAKEVMKSVEKAYDIEAESAYTLNFDKLPSVFINDSRFPVSPGTLETIRELTNNPSLESAGWLDYKTAYYTWMRNSINQSETIHAKANAENRDLTAEERKLLTDSNGRIAPARTNSPTRKNPVTFLSLEINEDIAIVTLDDGPRTVQLTLVLVDKKWYIAAYKGLAIHP